MKEPISTVLFINNKIMTRTSKLYLTAILCIIFVFLISCSKEPSDINNNSSESDSDNSTVESQELTTYITEDGTERLLSYDGITEFSKNKNVIIFVVDRFDSRYMERALKETPDVFYNLEGFTYFADHISLYGRTFPSITYMVTGCENDFSTSREQYFRKAYSDSAFLNLLRQNNYDIKIYTDTYYSYKDASVMGKYVSNIVTSDSENVYSTDQKFVYELLNKAEYCANSEKNNFSFIHIQGCHLPNAYDESFNTMADDHTDRWNELVAINTSMQIIDTYIAHMKELGIYNSSTIIIVGDHAAAISDSKELSGARRTALLVKPAGSRRGNIKTSYAQVAHENLWQTILESEKIEHTCDFETSVFSISNREKRIRRYNFQRMDSGYFENIFYSVNGSSSFFSNWTIIHREDIEGSVHQ